EGKNGRRRVTTRIGDQLGRADVRFEQFRQTIHRATEPLGIGMLVVVPLFVGGGVVQAIVGTEVDHSHARLEQRGNRLGRRSVRQAAEDAIAPLGERGGVQVFQRQVQTLG